MRLIRLFLLFLSTHICVCLHAIDAEITLETLHGHEVIPYLPKLAALRISFYRDYPYLYEGNLSEEEVYLRMYEQSENSVLVIARNGDDVVGAVSGLPLSESMEENRKLFEEKGISTEKVFYLAEIVVSQEWQQSDVQQKLYLQLERDIVAAGSYDTIALCEIQRTPQDAKSSLDLFSSEVVWTNTGFVKHPDLHTYYTWKDVGDLEETEHLMIFWRKPL